MTNIQQVQLLMQCMNYSVARIDTIQTGDINHISDNIYFYGCSNKCFFCHNPILQEHKPRNMSLESIRGQLSASKFVCLMGGEPMEQGKENIQLLIKYLHNQHRKVILFTSWNDDINVEADYIHIDIKKTDIQSLCIKDDNVTYGLVCTEGYEYSDIREIKNRIGDSDLYLKTPSQNNIKDNTLRIRDMFEKLGVRNLFINQRIKVK